MASPIIDNRFLMPDSKPEIVENFNRLVAIVDAVSGVVADLEESELFRVSFDSDGGTAVASQYVVNGEKATEPTDPTKDGYTFDGWFKGTATEAFDFDTEIEAHTALTAHWTAVPAEDPADNPGEDNTQEG